MGGSALSFKTRRIFPEEYAVITKEVLGVLVKENITKEARPTRNYSEKESFGDLDVICKGKKPEDVEEKLIKAFSAEEVYVNKEQVSFDYKNFQVDLLFFLKEEFLTAYFYYSFNDLNNFVGKVAHKFNLKFGHDGLSTPIRCRKGNVVGKIIISKSPREIYEFLDYNYYKWVFGFNTLEDIFRFVISSKFFSSDMFLDKNLNHRSRTRDKKRKVFIGFRQWLKDNNINKNCEFNPKKEEYIDFIDKSFPKCNYKKQLKDHEKREEIKEITSSKFNGNLVKEWTGLSGKELGKFMQEFKEGYKYNFDLWLLNTSQEHIKTKVAHEYNIRSGKH